MSKINPEVSDRDCPRKRGRNIVLCTDGTGNSGVAASKSNVWRLYQALDLSKDQRAFYVRGVGTSGFKVFKFLGGVFGFGLAENVRALYQYLCETYQPPSDCYEGDRVYIFGFSRGAFTARLLAGLIARCGILDRNKNINNKKTTLPINSKEGMTLAVRIAYASFRKACFSSAPLPTKVTRWVRDRLKGEVADPETFRAAHCYSDEIYRPPNQAPHKPPIETIGVWDTVSAYGMPVEELSEMLDKLVFSHRFEDHKLDPSIGHAYHALALDDERYSFHPLLFDENDPEDAKRITQVWFPGMHSDVGGGYPDGSLSMVTLQWMINAVARNKQGKGLDFEAAEVQSIQNSASSFGRMHNSRSGPAIYYRLAPRIINATDPKGNQLVPTPRIHRGVFDRITKGTAGYAPLVVPGNYTVVEYDESTGTRPAPETPEDIATRTNYQERIRNHVFWRRVMYLASTACTLPLFLAPLLFDRCPSCAPDLLARLTPDLAHPFIETWCSNPWWVVLWGVLLLAVAGHSVRVKANTDSIAELSWQLLQENTNDQPEPKSGLLEGMALYLRHSETANSIYKLFTRYLMPWALLILLGPLAVYGLYQLLASLLSWLGSGVWQIGHAIFAGWSG